jgi:hypothetical protein
MAAKNKNKKYFSVAMHIALSKTKIEALVLFGREMKNTTKMVESAGA